MNKAPMDKLPVSISAEEGEKLFREAKKRSEIKSGRKRKSEEDSDTGARSRAVGLSDHREISVKSRHGKGIDHYRGLKSAEDMYGNVMEEAVLLYAMRKLEKTNDGSTLLSSRYGGIHLLSALSLESGQRGKGVIVKTRVVNVSGEEFVLTKVTDSIILSGRVIEAKGVEWDGKMRDNYSNRTFSSQRGESFGGEKRGLQSIDEKRRLNQGLNVVRLPSYRPVVV